VTDAATVKKLRDMTNCGIMDCKRALKESENNIEKAVEVLRKKGIAKAGAKAARSTDQGRIETYVHLGAKLGVMLELKCETDFVARNEEFIALARDLCMHIAAMKPIAVSKENVPEELLEKEKEIYRESDEIKSKPENIREKIITGRLNKFYKDNVLLEQPFVKEEKTAVGEYVKQAIGKFGENITIGRFVRFELGEDAGSDTSKKAES